MTCDDRSEDETHAIVQSFSQSAPFEVRFVVNDVRLGVVRNFERALELCRGRYVALADQDDVWKREKLVHMLAATRHRGVYETTIGGSVQR
ncbi:MAG: glycosyltransferase [Gammaproteobacteria bacterium]